MAEDEETTTPTPPPPPSRKKWGWLVPVLVAILVFLLWPKEEHRETVERPARERWQGATARVEERTLPRQLELSGTLTPVRQATLSTRLSGRLLELTVEEGDRVNAGQVVARVDTSDLESRTAQARAGEVVAQAGTVQARASVRTAQSGLEQAQAQLKALQSQRGEVNARLELARTEHQRQSFLAAEGAIAQQVADRAKADFEVARSQQEQLEAGLKRAQAGVEAARAQLEEARTGISSSQAMVEQARAGTEAVASNLSYGLVQAPFPGVVSRKLLRQGELATPGAPILEIQDPYHLQLEVSVPEEALEAVRPGQTLELTLGTRKLRGKVRQIVPAADPASRSFTVKVAVENPKAELIPGMYGKLGLTVGKRQAVLVPSQAVSRRGQLEEVQVIDPEGYPELRLIKTGQAQGELVEVLSGLNAGETVGLP
ncbi:MAG: hypothetical protein AMXMBFR33_38180 [Candidatus Xenobia bacterium]